MNQTDEILKYLQAGNTLTPLECLKLGWGMRLAARIIELRRRGYNIITEGEKHYATYRLIPGVSQAVPASSFKKQDEMFSLGNLQTITHV
jgi:hypothetical protein